VLDEDIFFKGEIPKEEEPKRVVMLLLVETEEGYEADLVKDTDSLKYFTQLYIPRLKRELHGRLSGFGPDGTKYISFKLSGITAEEYVQAMKYDFLTDGGWFEERSTFPESV
jgi:hypothetical protein